MNNSNFFLIQNIIFPILSFLFLIFFYFLQKKSIKKDGFMFLKNVYARQNYLFSITLVGIFLGIYVLFKTLIKFDIGIQGREIFQATFDIGIIITYTFLIGCYYASLIAILGDIIAFFINSNGPFLFTFTFIYGLIPLIPFLLMIIFYKYKDKSGFTNITLIVFFIISCFSLIISLLLITNIIKTQEIFNNDIIGKIDKDITFSLLLLLTVFIWVLIIYIIKFKKNFFEKNFGYLILLSLIISYIMVSLIFDPLLLSELYNIPFKLLYIFRVSFIIFSITINFILSYSMVYLSSKYNKIDFFTNYIR